MTLKKYFIMEIKDKLRRMTSVVSTIDITICFYVILVYCLHAAASFKSPKSFNALRQGYQIKFLAVGKFSKND